MRCHILPLFSNIVQIFYILADFLCSVLSVIKNEVFRYPAIVELSVSVVASCIWRLSICLYAFIIVVYFWYIDPFYIMKYSFLSVVLFPVLKSILSGINITLSGLLWLLFGWYIFYFSFTFKIVLDFFKYVFCVQYVFRSCFSYSKWKPLPFANRNQRSRVMENLGTGFWDRMFKEGFFVKVTYKPKPKD